MRPGRRAGWTKSPRFFDVSTLVNDIRAGQSSLFACTEAGQALLAEQPGAPAQILPLCDGPQRGSAEELLRSIPPAGNVDGVLGCVPGGEIADELLGSVPGGDASDELLGRAPRTAERPSEAGPPPVPYRIVRFAPQQLKSDVAVRSAWKAALADVPDTDGSKTAFLHWLPSFFKRCWDTDRVMCVGKDYEHFLIGQLRRVQRKTSAERQKWFSQRLELMDKQIERGGSRPSPWDSSASASKKYRSV